MRHPAGRRGPRCAGAITTPVKPDHNGTTVVVSGIEIPNSSTNFLWTRRYAWRASAVRSDR